ncbi:hypothetical protein V2A60_002529 [Cordyceps javanica]|uniref:Acyl-CoA N-acyltransferase n=1 Tax=Cordyceps javanica TaxID=43265 RepID=A0A545UKE8_9HYPO|nr:Acyl-CoA N-acyltransferase [Cordyceps javanica]TQW01403.1 Acyl-CoA N-acyltransferase [Cordyceps javanica]
MTNLHPDHLRVRAAVPSDVGALATIVYHAMPMDPQWDYRFPLRKQYPEDNYGYTRLMMKSFLEAQGVFVSVVTFLTPGLGEDEEIPAAVAVWELDFNEKKDYSILPTANENCRRDANFEHMAAFSSVLQLAKKSYFDSTYQSQQLHLRVLATHPDFQRKGAGSALCNWGIEWAKQRHVPVTLFSSPMGQQLYSSLGFTKIGAVTVRVEGEQEELSIGVMEYSYKPV